MGKFGVQWVERKTWINWSQAPKHDSAILKLPRASFWTHKKISTKQIKKRIAFVISKDFIDMYKRYQTSLFYLGERFCCKISLETKQNSKMRGFEIPRFPLFPTCFSFRENVYYLII